MKSNANILSIDWDYFMRVSIEDRLRLFPDSGSEMITDIMMNFIWTARYAEAIRHGKDIRKIGVISAYHKVKEFLRCLPKDTTVYVADSHSYAYALCQSFGRPINIVNIDFHHDLYDNGDTVDCGNWLLQLLREYRVEKALWVKRKDSEVEGGVACDNVRVTEDIDSVLQIKYDAVFMCRSGAWTPPHLDKKFMELCSVVPNGSLIVREASIQQWDRYIEVKRSIPYWSKKLDLLDKLDEVQKAHE